MTYTDTTVQNRTTYYYVTTAVDSTGTESLYSPEAQAIIP
jgi:fibronectin type 3 domain-containing protein